VFGCEKRCGARGLISASTWARVHAERRIAPDDLATLKAMFERAQLLDQHLLREAHDALFQLARALRANHQHIRAERKPAFDPKRTFGVAYLVTKRRTLDPLCSWRCL
jgi:hypothetical protein